MSAVCYPRALSWTTRTRLKSLRPLTIPSCSQGLIQANALFKSPSLLFLILHFHRFEKLVNSRSTFLITTIHEARVIQFKGKTWNKHIFRVSELPCLLSMCWWFSFVFVTFFKQDLAFLHSFFSHLHITLKTQGKSLHLSLLIPRLAYCRFYIFKWIYFIPFWL